MINRNEDTLDIAKTIKFDPVLNKEDYIKLFIRKLK